MDVPVCPITHAPFEDPVLACDGFFYERVAIEAWLRDHDTSPCTRAVIDKVLIRSHAYTQLVADARRVHGLPCAPAAPAGRIPAAPDLTKEFLYAVNEGRLEDVQRLVAQGVDVHADDDYALRWAAGSGHLPIVQFLIAHGADVHIYNDVPLRNAVEYGHLPVVQCLVAHGADVHAFDDQAVRVACRYGDLHIVQFLVAHGVDARAYLDEALSEAGHHTAVIDFLRSL